MVIVMAKGIPALPSIPATILKSQMCQLLPLAWIYVGAAKSGKWSLQDRLRSHQRLGDILKRRKKCRAMWLWSEKPAA